MKQTALFVFIFLPLLLLAQTPDVQHYRFSVQLSDAYDTIRGQAVVMYQMAQPSAAVHLHLQSVHNGRGMKVLSVQAEGKAIPFSHSGDVLHVTFAQTQPTATTRELVIHYAGIPADGLIISKNKYGDRTFFSDNWPNRARQWIPCNDRPDDKASVEFIVTAPMHYQVISNGVQVEETAVSSTHKKHHWKESVAIPTKVMVIGAARMAAGFIDSAVGVPVSAWVYPQDRDKGFHDYAITGRMLQFFSQYIGPYGFQKLANVQSKTEFGGMENASAIFYAETSVTGDRRNEDLMAHEVAHQWFGNMATERSFAHLWLSEGFATYLTNIYLERQYGVKALQDRMRSDRETVIQFARQSSRPVVDPTDNLMSLLNANSYQKGGWVLHLLRRKVGDAPFQKILQTYYARYRGSNADTDDFRKVAEEVSGISLEPFFQQWLYGPGVPKVEVRWKYSRGQLQLVVQQTGDEFFDFPLEIALVNSAGQQELHTLHINKIRDSFSVPATAKPTVLLLDPNVNMLFEGSVREER
jgi:aminopeptidase N